jgi:hypothetical protein
MAWLLDQIAAAALNEIWFVEWLCVWSAGFGAWCSDLMILYQLQSLFLMDLLHCVRMWLMTWRKLGEVLGVSQ